MPSGGRLRRRSRRTQRLRLAAFLLTIVCCATVGAVLFARFGAHGPAPVDPRVYRDYDPATGALRTLVYDAHGRHKPDTWSYLSNGRVILTKVDEDGDGVIDTWYHYRLDGSVEKTGFSTKNDGVEDAWRYESPEGDLIKIEYSAARDGVVTRTDYVKDHQPVR